MKALFLFVIMQIVTCCSTAQSQTGYLKSLPKNLVLDKTLPRSYEMITDYRNYDFTGNFESIRRLKGDVVYEGDTLHWNNVYASYSKNENEIPKGERLESLDGFKYVNGVELVDPQYLRNNLPKAEVPVLSMMWDVMMFEMVYPYFEQLQLNKQFHAKEVNGPVPLAGEGSFENKDFNLEWIGITEKNGVTCAIIKYSAMNNPMKLKYGNTLMRGRSHYWGEIYVSLTTKHIEYAFLMEDVISDVENKVTEEKKAGYTLRTITFSKING